ncbi:MAG TPA: ClbS/DfsB family four-helix bundle protein [Herpetosiphonaceae bacterium]
MPRRPPANTLTTRDAFFVREAASWMALTATWADLPDDALVIAGASGTTWSIKDVMNHIAAWHEAALRCIGDLQAGRWARLGPALAQFNAQQYATDARRTLADSRLRFTTTHDRLLALLRTLSEPDLLNEYGRQQMGWWAKWTTYAHYEQHLTDLTGFRQQAQNWGDG